jgi:hypothetical protein
MARIVAMLAPLLKAAGFLKRRHSFNRTTADGLVHVVALWMAPREPPAWTEVPGLRERVFGSFRLDLGVRVPEMTRTGTTPTTWVDGHQCQLRRAGEWCDLRDERAEEAARTSLLEQAFPWLDRFGTKHAVIESFERYGAAGIGMAPAGDLDIAQLQQALGLEADARLTLERYVARGIPRSHAHYLADYLPGIGYGDLAPRATDLP